MECLVQVGQKLQEADAVLAAEGVSEHRLKAEYILCRALGCHRLELPSWQNRELSANQAEQISAQVERVLEGEPIQYVLGDMDFMGRLFKTDSRALIPRPETETLVENVLACKDVWSLEVPVVADVGTGTGCVIVTLALERPNGEYLAIDTSAGALELARENARNLGVEVVTTELNPPRPSAFARATADKAGTPPKEGSDRGIPSMGGVAEGRGGLSRRAEIEFRQGDLLSGIRSGSLDLVVSNPPYVATAEIETLQADIRNHEPRLALDGGPDGMAVISKLVPQAHGCLRPGGWLFMEIGEDQGERVKALMERSGFEQIEIQKDLSGHDRIARGQRI